MAEKPVQKTPLEVVEQTIIEMRELTQSSALVAVAIFEELKKNGYVIAKARVQWRH